MNPRSTDCEAGALTTTPSRRIHKTKLIYTESSNRRGALILLPYEDVCVDRDWLFTLLFLEGRENEWNGLTVSS